VIPPLRCRRHWCAKPDAAAKWSDALSAQGAGNETMCCRSNSNDALSVSTRVSINSLFSAKQTAFLDFVLSHYVSVGVGELDQEKLTPLLRLKYHDSIADAIADLGRPDEIGQVFIGFQKYLYQQQAVA
jgi:hypothetical protein